LSSVPATKSTTDTNSADVSDTVESSTATDLFSVHDFDVNINMDITPGRTYISIPVLYIFMLLRQFGLILLRKHVLISLLTGSIVRSTKRRYLSYSEGDFEVFAQHERHIASSGDIGVKDPKN